MVFISKKAVKNEVDKVSIKLINKTALVLDIHISSRKKHLIGPNYRMNRNIYQR